MKSVVVDEMDGVSEGVSEPFTCATCATVADCVSGL